jgi:hypothetical protein
MSNLYRKWWFWLLVIVVLVILYFILGALGIIPTYQCGSTMGPNGPVNWCQWRYGTIVG